MLRRFVAGTAALSMLLSACSFQEDAALADRCVARFHEQLDAEQYHEIYTQSDRALQGAASEADLARLLGSVHGKLGTVKASANQSWNVQHPFTGPVRARVEARYATTFSKANAVESFLVVIEGEQCRLAGYNVNSNAFVVE
jgi:hypothetical protein